MTIVFHARATRNSQAVSTRQRFETRRNIRLRGARACPRCPKDRSPTMVARIGFPGRQMCQMSCA